MGLSLGDESNFVHELQIMKYAVKLNCQQLKSCTVLYFTGYYCCYGAIRLVFYLQDGAAPLFVACQNGHLPVVKCLIETKADVNTPTKVGYLLTVL